MKMCKFPEAVPYYRKAIEVEPDNAVNYYKLYSVHKRMRSLSEALTDITQAVELNGSRADWRIQKAKLLVNLGRCDEAAVEYAAARENAADARQAKETADGTRDTIGLTSSRRRLQTGAQNPEKTDEEGQEG